MTITLHLEPHVEAALSARAQAEGLPLDAYVGMVIEQIAAQEPRPELSAEEFEAAMDTLAEGSEKLPVLPPEAYSRESIYGDG